MIERPSGRIDDRDPDGYADTHVRPAIASELVHAHLFVFEQFCWITHRHPRGEPPSFPLTHIEGIHLCHEEYVGIASPESLPGAGRCLVGFDSGNG